MSFFKGEPVKVKGWPMVGTLRELDGSQFIVEFGNGVKAYGHVEHLEQVPLTYPEIIIKHVGGGK